MFLGAYLSRKVSEKWRRTGNGTGKKLGRGKPLIPDLSLRALGSYRTQMFFSYRCRWSCCGLQDSWRLLQQRCCGPSRCGSQWFDELSEAGESIAAGMFRETFLKACMGAGSGGLEQFEWEESVRRENQVRVLPDGLAQRIQSHESCLDAELFLLMRDLMEICLRKDG